MILVEFESFPKSSSCSVFSGFGAVAPYPTCLPAAVAFQASAPECWVLTVFGSGIASSSPLPTFHSPIRRPSRSPRSPFDHLVLRASLQLHATNIALPKLLLKERHQSQCRFSGHQPAYSYRPHTLSGPARRYEHSALASADLPPIPMRTTLSLQLAGYGVSHQVPSKRKRDGRASSSGVSAAAQSWES